MSDYKKLLGLLQEFLKQPHRTVELDGHKWARVSDLEDLLLSNADTSLMMELRRYEIKRSLEKGEKDAETANAKGTKGKKGSRISSYTVEEQLRFALKKLVSELLSYARPYGVVSKMGSSGRRREYFRTKLPSEQNQNSVKQNVTEIVKEVFRTQGKTLDPRGSFPTFSMGLTELTEIVISQLQDPEEKSRVTKCFNALNRMKTRLHILLIEGDAAILVDKPYTESIVNA